jgi:hypothetical protein
MRFRRVFARLQPQPIALDPFPRREGTARRKRARVRLFLRLDKPASITKSFFNINRRTSGAYI